MMASKLASSESKRKHLRSLGGTVSPPPRRRKLPSPKESQPTERDDAHCSEEAANGKDRRLKDIEKEHLRVTSWNVNGIHHLLPSDSKKITSFFSSSKRGDDRSREETPPRVGDDLEDTESSMLRKFIMRHKCPHIICLQEVHIAQKEHDRMRTRVTRAANDGFSEASETYEVYFSLPRDKNNATGFGGRVHGVCTLVRRDLSSSFGTDVKTTQIEFELEGRILVTELQPVKNPTQKTLVLNMYWPNGTTYAWRNSRGAICGTRHDFKRDFHKKVQDLLQSYEADSSFILMIGDMNIAPSRIDGYPNLRAGEEHVTNRADFNFRFLDHENADGFRGIDTFRHLHGNVKGYTYHGEKVEEWGRSCDRVDLGIVNTNVVDSVALVRADIFETIEDRGASDHVPIGVEIDLSHLLREVT
jgi:exonuclease III